MKNNRTLWKKINGSYKYELNKIKEIRHIRDSVENECNGECNEGRIKKLIMNYPFVSSIQIVNPSIGFRVSVKTNGGYEYSFWDDDAFREVNKLLYNGYLDKRVY